MYTSGPGSPVQKWAGFEDMRSIDFKVKYLMSAGLGGASIFSIDMDDYSDVCYQGKFPLLRVVNHHLNKNIDVPYPEFDQIDNPAWAVWFYPVEKQGFLKALFENSKSSGNKSNHSRYFAWSCLIQTNSSVFSLNFQGQVLDSFCECKKGKHTLKMTQDSIISPSIVIDCDRVAVDNADQVNTVHIQDNFVIIDFVAKNQLREITNGAKRLSLTGVYITVYLCAIVIDFLQ